MIQFGYSLGFAGFSSYQSQSTQSLPQALPQGSAQDVPAPAHTTTNPTMSSAMALPMYPVAMMSPAYMMAYPQMSSPMGMAPMGMPQNGGMLGGMNDATMAGAAPASGGGHVTANPTNSLASSASSGMASGMSGFGMDPMSGMGGYGGFGGVGMYGAFVMPVVMMVPVFIQMGYPVFQGSQAQPPVPSSGASGASAAAEAVQAEAGVETPGADLGEAVAPAPVNTEGVVIDVVPTAKDETAGLPRLPITELGAEDFAKYRLIEKSKQQETSLSLTLITQDGDKISLEFNQLDSMQMSRFHGRTLEGEKVKDMAFTEETDRVVNMEVIGDLSDDEKAAVDKVLSTIIEAVSKFFSGDVGQAVDKLKQMEFDGQQLAELSLNMSMSKSADISKAYHNGAEHLHELKNRDADIGQALDFLASEQKRLIEVAREFFDAPSAAKLVRSLVAPLLSEPFGQLSEQIAAAKELDTAETPAETIDAEESNAEDVAQESDVEEGEGD
jgi:hypothetical protein